jgi:hypothetical protein
MGTSLMVYAMNRLDEPEEVLMWDGGLPQHSAAAISVSVDV